MFLPSFSSFPFIFPASTFTFLSVLAKYAPFFSAMCHCLKLSVSPSYRLCERPIRSFSTHFIFLLSGYASLSLLRLAVEFPNTPPSNSFLLLTLPERFLRPSAIARRYPPTFQTHSLFYPQLGLFPPFFPHFVQERRPCFHTEPTPDLLREAREFTSTQSFPPALLPFPGVLSSQ